MERAREPERVGVRIIIGVDPKAVARAALEPADPAIRRWPARRSGRRPSRAAGTATSPPEETTEPRRGSLELRSALDLAIKDKSVIRIVYHGGSRPGSVRDVRPIYLTDDSVRALDVAAGMDKTFLLAKLEISAGDVPATPPGNPQTVEEAVALRVPELQALGWHVELTRDSIGLSVFFKNGKPQKTPRVALTFDQYTGIGVIDIADDGKWVQRDERWESRTPYHVWGRDVLAPRHFGNIWRAVALFLDEASRRSPRGDQER